MRTQSIDSVTDVPVMRIPLSVKPQITSAGKVNYVRTFSQVCPPCPENIWWLHLYHFDTTIRIDGRQFQVHPGYVSLIGPGGEFQMEYVERGTYLFAHFRMDAPADAPTYAVTALQDLGETFQSLSDDFETVSTRFNHDPLWADITLWNILFQLAEGQKKNVEAALKLHPVVANLLHIVDVEINYSLNAELLAERVGVTARHLNKLFNREIGMSLMEYVRHRRVEVAYSLLIKTRLPITLIAVDVGIPNLAHFNRLMHRQYGNSPRQLRSIAWAGAPPEQQSDTVDEIRRPYFYYQM